MQSSDIPSQFWLRSTVAIIRSAKVKISMIGCDLNKAQAKLGSIQDINRSIEKKEIFMTRIPCPECKEQINESVEGCPQCGYILTPEDVARIKKKRKEWKISFIMMGATVIIGIVLISLPIINTELEQSGERDNYLKRTKSSTGTSTHSSQPQRPKTIDTQQEQTAANEAWLGTWSLEFIDEQPTAKNLASGLRSDIFVSWNYTFYADGRFESKLRQDTGNGILTTTASGTYEVSGNTYNTVLKEAIMSIGSTSDSVPNVSSYQTGKWSGTENTLTMFPVGSSIKAFRRIY